jgi:hypothetical protein
MGLTAGDPMTVVRKRELGVSPIGGHIVVALVARLRRRGHGHRHAAHFLYQW